MESMLMKALVKRHTRNSQYEKMDNENYQTIKVQLLAHDLVKFEHLNTVKGGTALFWSLTPAGQKLMLTVGTVKKIGE